MFYIASLEGSLHGGSLHGGSCGGILHGGFLHVDLSGGSLTGGSVHDGVSGGSLIGGSLAIDEWLHGASFVPGGQFITDVISVPLLEYGHMRVGGVPRGDEMIALHNEMSCIMRTGDEFGRYPKQPQWDVMSVDNACLRR